MRECALCHTQTEDQVTTCPGCGADLETDSVRAHALRVIVGNPRASMVYIVAPEDACPTCRAVQGTYEKDSVPKLPVEGCSCPHGCLLQYEPFVFEVGP